MNECEPYLSPDAPIGQGDIFAWGNWSERDEWDQFGMVVTADCDIAHDRASNFLTYLPILSLAAYVKLVWVRQRIAKLLVQHQRQTSEEIHRLHLKLNPGATKLESVVSNRWIIQSTNELILKALNVSEKKEITNITKLLEVYRSLEAASRGDTMGDLVQTYCEIRASKQSIPTTRAKEIVARDMHSDVVQNLPLECFFLTSLPQIDALGFIVMLRHIQPIKPQTLTASYTEAKGLDNRAYRLGRLSPTFKYALTQKFGTLFSRIGLPVDYEEWQDAIAQEVSSEIVSEVVGGTQ